LRIVKWFHKLSGKKQAKKKTLKFKVKEIEDVFVDSAYVTVEFEDGRVIRDVPVREGEDVAIAVRKHLDFLKQLKKKQERVLDYARKLVGKEFEVTMEEGE